MPTWAQINSKIAACRASPNLLRALEELFAKTPDAHVAMALGDEHRDAGHLEAALRYYREALRLYPYETYKARARRAIAQVSGATPLAAAAVSRFGVNEDELHVISCSRRKAWDDPAVTERYLPARDAYRGDEITSWLKRPESGSARWLILSAKYGFIEPDHPIANYDVTFNDAKTGPITDDALISQARYQCRWADRVPLRGFSRVSVHGSGEYLKKVRMAFAPIRSAVVSSEEFGHENAIGVSPGRPIIDEHRAACLAAALAALPMDTYERLDANEPEWPIFGRLAQVEHPWGVVCALGCALSDYQLAAGGADEYWATIARLLGDWPVDSKAKLEVFFTRLVRQPVSIRLADQKLTRVQKLLASDISDWCGRQTFEVLGRDAGALWNRLAAVMGQRPDAKTIAFAMKCFDLLHKVKTGRYVSSPSR